MATKPRTKKPAAPQNSGPSQVVHIPRIERPLFPDAPKGHKTWTAYLAKSAAAASNQAVTLGMKDKPFDFRAVNEFQKFNIHHGRCIHTKVASTIGLGFSSDKVAEILDPLCDASWQETLNDIVEDRAQTGNGYLEVVRESADATAPIVGLHHIPAADVSIVIENRRYDRHYMLDAVDEGVGTVRFAKFGDLLDFTSSERRTGINALGFGAPMENGRVSELIPFRRASSLSRWYGYPDWLAAVSAIELVQALIQHNFDFFNNRGVPEFLLFILGTLVGKDDWRKIENVMKAQVGLGNRYKSAALNLDNPNTKVQVEKLAMEGKSDASLFSTMSDSLSLDIVSAHGVPPLLAGIVIPGKLGANNELPNALMAFQALVIGPTQHAIETTLATTLGDRKLNGGLALRPKDFLGKMVMDPISGRMKKEGGLRTILEAIDIGLGGGGAAGAGAGLAAADTIGRMRTPLAQAKAEGRDIGAGLKKEDIDELQGSAAVKAALANILAFVRAAG